MPVVEKLVESLGCDGGRTVSFALGLLDDDFHLPRQLTCVQHRIRVSVGLNVQALRETRRRKNRVVGRVVVDGLGVEIAAARFGFLRNCADATLLRSLEEHVLERMGETVLFVGLVEVTSLDVGDDRDHRRRRLLLNENGETVGQHRAVNALWIHCREDALIDASQVVTRDAG